MNILVTIDSNYIKPLKVMLKSLFLNNPEENFFIYLLHSSLTAEELNDLDQYISVQGHELKIVSINDDYFEDAPVILHYSKEMYYRLLAFKFLPSELKRVLYLDPDILVINPIRELYNQDLEGYLYAAAYHDLLTVREINKLRLKPYEIDAYYNSGVLLMNLELQRQTIDEREIFDFIAQSKVKLLLPDQDVINALYAKQIKTLDEKLYNYDARHYLYYKLVTNGLYDMDYVIRNTVILHFCGKKKPWLKGYSGKFHSLYKHYEKQAI
ncbi:MAG: glycosyltransferase family 8 protein [Peptococcaceae bacterium]|mgnify:CR=1 FL=1|nr:glycosyltransferase family 8 protein [Peptococcaceae bacterium]